MSSDEMRRRADAFRSTGVTYHRYRPGYPDDAVGWALPDGARDVLDLGAGTGRLTDALLERGLTVTAVDPSASMLAVLAARHPDVSVVEARAEATGLADASFDAIVVGQAWHWIDPAAGSAEAARLLRPRGTIAMLWNQRVPEDGWQAAFEAVQPDPRGVDLISRHDADARFPFGAREEFRTAWERTIPAEDYVQLYTTQSPFLIASPEEQARRLATWRSLLRAHAVDRVTQRYATTVWRFQLPG